MESTTTWTHGSFQVYSLADAGSDARYVYKRRLHTKTRAGCHACKVKKVKCDESKPTCNRCQKRGSLCSYGQHGIVETSQSIREQSLSLDAPAKSTMHVDHTLSALSCVTLDPAPTPTTKIRNGTPTIQLLHHLCEYGASILPIPSAEAIISFYSQSSLVRHTVLAITASHLRHLSPETVEHRVAEHYQQSLALEHFKRNMMVVPESLGQSGVNVLLISAILLNVLAFTIPDVEKTDVWSSWVFSTEKECLGWLSLQAGLRPLLLSMPDYLKGAREILSPIFLGEGQDWSFVTMADALEVIPPSWKTIFELEATDVGCESPGDVFGAPVKVLSQLRLVRPGHFNILRMFPFLSKLHGEFRSLLLSREARALWLLGYWLGVMCRFEKVWWCARRAKRDFTAVCTWLDQLDLPGRPGVEGEAWTEMMAELHAEPTLFS